MNPNGVFDGAERKKDSRLMSFSCLRKVTGFQLFTFTFFGTSAILVLLVFWTSRLLRPALDDYRLGVVADQGPIGGVWLWWNTWSGDLTQILANNLFVGIPLRHLPWSLASAVPFIAAALSVTALLLGILLVSSRGDTTKRHRLLGSLILFPVILISWWSYWWITASLSPDELNAVPLAVGLTMWQNLNSAYIITWALVMLGWILIEARTPSRRPWQVLLYLVIGLLAGFAGPVFALSALIMLSLLAYALWLRTPEGWKCRLELWLLTAIGIAVGAAVSFTSPGAEARRSQGTNAQTDEGLFPRILSDAFPNGIEDWWLSLTTPGAFILFTLFVGLSLVLALQGWSTSFEYLTAVGLGLLVFSVVASVVNRVSELFVYPAYWHLAGSRMLIWAAAVVLGVGFGGWIASFGRNTVAAPFLLFATAVSFLLAVSSVANMLGQIQARNLQWEVGPAPWASEAILDIETGWVRSDWRDLQRLRDAPTRLPPD